MKHSFLRMSILALAGSFSAFAAAPQYVLSYFVNPNGNQTGFTNPIILPPTTVGATTSATVVIFNQGDGDEVINSITGGAGTTFQLSACLLSKDSATEYERHFYRQLYAYIARIGVRERDYQFRYRLSKRLSPTATGASFQS